MPWPAADGVLITGVYGSGKSSVAAEITYLLEQRDQPYALLDLDYLGWVDDHAMGHRRSPRVRASALKTLWSATTRPVGIVAREMTSWLGWL
jgi:adenylylsulfate kinase-like enzyme